MTKEDMILNRISSMDAKLDCCIKDIAGLKVRSGIWGALAGLIPVTIGLGMYVLSVAG